MSRSWSCIIETFTRSGAAGWFDHSVKAKAKYGREMVATDSRSTQMVRDGKYPARLASRQCAIVGELFGGALFGNPVFDNSVEHVQRDGSLTENRVVEVSQVEFVAEFGLGFLAKFQDS